MSTNHTSGQSADLLAPPAQWHDEDERSHVVQFYTEDGFLLDGLSRFMGTALGAGDAAVVIATQAHRVGLVERLKARGFDLTNAILQGRYVSLDAAGTLAKFMVGGTPDAARFVELIGGILARVQAASEGENPRIVAFGQMVALLWAEGNYDAAIRVEQLWNELARTQSFSLRCAYPIQGFGRDEHTASFGRICSEHSDVIPGESYTALINEDERLRNISSLQQKAQALETEKAERKEVQKSLRRREAELADFLENAVEGVQRVGPDQRVLWANKALLNLLGYSGPEYINHSLAEFHVRRNIFDEFWRRLMRGEDIQDYPAELRCKNGSTKHVVIHSNGLWEDGRFVHTRCFIRDVTEQKRLEQELRKSEARLRQVNNELESQVEQRTTALRRLSARILRLQDSERRRIARELHDSLGQYLVGLKINIDMLRQSPGSSELWAQSEQLMQKCTCEIRTLSHLLHPPMMDEAGLASAAQWFVESFGKRSGLQATLDMPEDLARLPDTVELALFRVLQEAVTNVHRHSGASAVDVRILHDAEEVVLEVKDNGRGIPEELLDRFKEIGTGMGVGLTGMRERVHELGGMLTIQSDASGTSLQAVIPVAAAVPVLAES